jgi:transcriptional regulator with XRE-family HTH domain
MPKPKYELFEGVGPSGFGGRLVNLRTKRKLSRKQLASEIRVTVPTIRLWEMGAYSPGYWNLVELAKFFGISPNWLLGMSTLKEHLE